jgi:hypothetical protein
VVDTNIACGLVKSEVHLIQPLRPPSLRPESCKSDIVMYLPIVRPWRETNGDWLFVLYPARVVGLRHRANKIRPADYLAPTTILKWFVLFSTICRDIQIISSQVKLSSVFVFLQQYAVRTNYPSKIFERTESQLLRSVTRVCGLSESKLGAFHLWRFKIW